MADLRNCDYHKRKNIAKPGFKEVDGEVMCKECFGGSAIHEPAPAAVEPVKKKAAIPAPFTPCQCKPGCPKAGVHEIGGKLYAHSHWPKRPQQSTSQVSPRKSPASVGEPERREPAFPTTTKLLVRDAANVNERVEIKVPVSILDDMWSRLSAADKGVALGQYFEYLAL